MASPQLENGFTPIANTLLEATFCYGLNGVEIEIVLLLWRCIYGFKNSKIMFSEAALSPKDIAKYTGRDIGAIKRAINKLVELNVIHVIKGKPPKIKPRIKLNKDYESWIDFRGIRFDASHFMNIMRSATSPNGCQNELIKSINGCQNELMMGTGTTPYERQNEPITPPSNLMQQGVADRANKRKEKVRKEQYLHGQSH